MSRSLVSVAVASVALLSGGCGTFVNGSPLFNGGDMSKVDRVYGGVRLDVEGVEKAFGLVVRGEAAGPQEAAFAFLGSGFLFIDLPLSAVADTLLLPRALRVLRDRRLAAVDAGQPNPEPSAPGASDLPAAGDPAAAGPGR